MGVPGHVHSERGSRYQPSPPPGQGPVLVWFRTSRREVARIAVLTPALMAVFLTLRSASLDWVGSWWAWLFVIPPLFGYGWINHGRSYAAGASWLAIGPRSWVRTHELVEARVVPGGLTHNLVLTDSGGRRVSASMPSLQVKPELWALVYQGMRHSVRVRQVRTNTLTRAMLRVPPAPQHPAGFVLPQVRFPHSHRASRRNRRRDGSR